MRRCRECGCTDPNPCVEDGMPCGWAEADLCTSCSPIRVITEATLYEISIVHEPANPHARILSVTKKED